MLFRSAEHKLTEDKKEVDDQRKKDRKDLFIRMMRIHQMDDGKHAREFTRSKINYEIIIDACELLHERIAALELSRHPVVTD